jgi:hypothetical protein
MDPTCTSRPDKTNYIMSLSVYFQQFLSVFVAVGVFRTQKDPTHRFRADEDVNLDGEQAMRREQADGTYRPRNRKLARQAFGKKI